MKEKIDQLENLLNEISREVDRRLKIDVIDVEEYDDLICEFEKEYFSIHSEEKKETFNRLKVNLIEDLIAKKNDRSFFNNDIPRLKSLLCDKLSKLENINNKMIADTRFGSRLKGPNPEFKRMLQENILSTETRIFGRFNHIIYEGHLTRDGYFSLTVDAKKAKLFSSLSTAGSYVCNKPVLKGWELWFAIDENGNEQKMLYFTRNILSRQLQS